ncbi:hypothetical protein AHAS_Ahas07G0121500 [Arachis hypogaea]
MFKLLIDFLFSQVDSEIQKLYDGATLSTRGSDEFVPSSTAFLSSSFVTARRRPTALFVFSLEKSNADKIRVLVDKPTAMRRISAVTMEISWRPSYGNNSKRFGKKVGVLIN